jgi:hypothetical protein
MTKNILFFSQSRDTLTKVLCDRPKFRVRCVRCVRCITESVFLDVTPLFVSRDSCKKVLVVTCESRLCHMSVKTHVTQSTHQQSAFCGTGVVVISFSGAVAPDTQTPRSNMSQPQSAHDIILFGSVSLVTLELVDLLRDHPYRNQPPPPFDKIEFTVNSVARTAGLAAVIYGLFKLVTG